MTLIAALLWMTSIASAQSDYLIGPGDRIDINIHGVDLGTDDLQVALDGTISFPFVGQVKLQGLSTREAQAHLKSVLADGYLVNPEISVRIKTFTSQKVELFGAVKTAGVYNLEGTTTLRSLVAKAGGIEFDRSTGFIKVIRDNTEHTVRITELQGEAGDYVLHGGDVVDITIGNTIFLAGEIANPGAVSYNRGLTASQALLMAGGRTEFGRLSGAYIIRGDERIQVNLKRVLKGKDADVELRPGDRMVIPVSAI